MFRHALHRLREIRQLLIQIQDELRSAIVLYKEFIEIGKADDDREDAELINQITGKISDESVEMQAALDKTITQP